jgi:hypothetical protein
MNQAPTGMAPQKAKIPGYKHRQIPNMTPAMMELMQALTQGLTPGAASGTDFLSKLAGGDESMFEQLEAPAYAAFEKLLGQTGTRFSDLGARDSSYFENAVAGQGVELAQNLQSQRLGIRNQAIQSLLGNSQQALNQRPYENIVTPKEPSWFDKYLQFASANFQNASKASMAGI